MSDAVTIGFADAGPADGCLAVVRFAAPDRGGAGPGEIVAPVPPLEGSPETERWLVSGAVRRRRGEIDLADGGGLIFAAMTARGAGGDDLERAANDAYRSLLRRVEAAGYPHLLRAWNFVPRINEASRGIERYKLFCKGRSEAYAEHYGAAFRDSLPASSAVGCAGDALVVHLLAAKDPGRHLENPRQTSAYHYPARYGPRSPSFARATVAPPGAGGLLLVSGTASIVGHESVHLGDAAAQTEETLRTVEVLLDLAGVPGAGGPLGPRLLAIRVYLRDAGDRDTVRATLDRALAAPVPTAIVQADVCRIELLVEIEAVAARPS